MSEQNEVAESASVERPETAAERRKRMARKGYGNGPMIVTLVMAAGALSLAGAGLVHSANSDDGLVSTLQDRFGVETVADVDQTPTSEGKITVELPDVDGNGIPDAFEQKEPVQSPVPSTPQPEAPKPEPAPEPQPSSYRVEQGDTLAEISAETGVSVDALAKANDIKNPNLIFAGSALLIPVQ